MLALVSNEKAYAPACIIVQAEVHTIPVVVIRVDFPGDPHPFFYLVRLWHDGDLKDWKLILSVDDQETNYYILPQSDGYGYCNTEQDAMEELQLLKDGPFHKQFDELVGEV